MSLDLTPRESTVLSLVARGYTDARVAAEMFIAPSSVKQHLTNVYIKLGVYQAGRSKRSQNSRVLAARWYWENVELPSRDAA